MLVIGLTGGIGSGKSTVAALFSALGITVIDTDQLARDVTQQGQPALTEIVKEFDQTILQADGSLDRAKLRRYIFNDAKKRDWLEKLLHPLIRKEMKLQAENAISPYCIIVIPLLLETEPNPLIDRILVVNASRDQQINRTIKRDNTKQEDVEAIMQTQISQTKRLMAANDIIENNGTIEELIPQVEKLHQYYLSLATKSNIKK